MPISSKPDQSPAPTDVLLSVKQFVSQQPALCGGGVRWTIFHAEYNGLAESGAIVRVGRRVLIDPPKYMAWMRTNPKLSPPRPKAMKSATPTPEIKTAKRAGSQAASKNQEACA